MTQFEELVTSSLSEICQITRNNLAPSCTLKFIFYFVLFEASKDQNRFFWTQFSKALASALNFNWLCAICCYLLKALSTSYHWASCCPPTLHLILPSPSSCIIIPLQWLGEGVIAFRCSWLTSFCLSTQLGTPCSPQSLWCCPDCWWFPQCSSQRFPPGHALYFLLDLAGAYSAGNVVVGMFPSESLW